MCASAFDVMISMFLCKMPSCRIIDARNLISEIRQSERLRSLDISAKREIEYCCDEECCNEDEDCGDEFIYLVFHVCDLRE